MPNIEMMRLALKEIEREPETWSQNSWHCGTTCCFAGKVALLAGATWASSRPDTEYVYTPDDRFISVSAYAIEVLDIDWTEAFGLFYGPTNFERLSGFVEQIAARETN